MFPRSSCSGGFDNAAVAREAQRASVAVTQKARMVEVCYR